MAFWIFNKIGKFVRKRVTSIDKFHRSIEFTYQGKSNFKTFCGGVYTIMVIVMIIMYGIILFKGMINRNRSNVSLSTKIVDLNVDTRVHYPGLNGFDFAIAFSNDYGQTVALNESIVTLHINHYSINRYTQEIINETISYKQ